MRLVRLVCALAVSMCLSVNGAAAQFSDPERVVIEGYEDHAMEPFLSRDDQILFFNNSNDPKTNTDLHWAERRTATRFVYRGPVHGANTSKLEGVPSMDRNGTLYFVSTRSYRRTLSTIYRAQFQSGRAIDVRIADGLSRRKLGQLNFDVEVSSDGTYLFAVDGQFDGGSIPKTADIFVARRTKASFKRFPNSAEILAHINTSALEYAPAISADGLELFFTRMTSTLFQRKLTIMLARRSSIAAPFEKPSTIEAIRGFVEAPTISSDGLSLYYHRKIDGVHRIYRVTRPRR